MVRGGSLMKVQFVLEAARKDSRFMNDLDRDPHRTLLESGIDLSTGEVLALLDIVRNQSSSPLAPSLTKLRQYWGDVLRDSARTDRKE